MPRARLAAVALGAILLSLASSAQATIWSVPGDMSGACSVFTPSCDTLADAVAAASPADSILLGAGVHVATAVSLDKALIVQGAGPLATFLEPAAGQPALLIAASGITVRDLTVRNSTVDGVRISIASTVVDDLQFDAVHFRASGATGWKYKDTTGAQDGVQKVLLKSGAQGKAKALVKGKGTGLPDFPTNTLPIADFPVTAQLINLESNLCLGATFDALDIKKNSTNQLKLKAQ